MEPWVQFLAWARLCMCKHMREHVCHAVHVEVRRQLWELALCYGGPETELRLSGLKEAT